MSHEPVKPLFEDASAPNELRNFVALARNDGASQADLDRLTMRLAPVLGVSAALIASSAAAIGSTAPLAAASSFGAPASGLTPALGAASAAKLGAGAGAVSVAKVGLFGQLMASASAKVLAVSLSIGAAGVAVYNATTSGRPPSGSQVPVVGPSGTARPNALPGGSAASPPGEGTAVPALADSPVPTEGAAPLNAASVEQLSPSDAQPHAVRGASLVLPTRGRARFGARKAPVVRHASSPAPSQVEPGAPAASDTPITDAPVAAQAAPDDKPSLPPPSELSLIERAEASRARPGEALAFLAKHEEVYPRGALAQEREVLAIELLLKAGKLGRAETRAERFEDAYPRSAHLPRLRALFTRAHAE